MAYAYLLPLTLLVALVTALWATPLALRVALRVGAVDRPAPHHAGALKPRLGGIALYLAFGLAILLPWPWVADRTVEEARRVIGLLLGATVLVVVGAVDDRKDLSAWPQLVAQVLAAVIALLFGIRINQVPNPFGSNLEASVWLLPPGVNELVTVVWLIGAVNAINFVDGLDGLAAGVAVIGAAVLFLHSSQLGQYSVALLPLALAGASLGFLRYNLTPARITLGTSGALFLGFALASQAVIGGTKAATALLVLGLPLLDAAFIVVRRLLQGHAPWRGDRTHLHHRLQQAGLSERQVVLLFYGFSLAAGALALLLSSRLFKLYALGGLTVLVVVALVLLARLPVGEGQRELREE